MLDDFHSGDQTLSQLDREIEQHCKNALLKITGCNNTHSPHVDAQDEKVDWHRSWEESIESAIDTIVDHEFYAVDYATKVQPQAEGLLQTLHDSMLRHLRFGNSESWSETSELSPTEKLHDRARRLMHRLVSATNRLSLIHI